MQTVIGGVIDGVDGRVVSVECSIGPGRNAFEVVGPAELVVRELRTRVRAAINRAGVFPSGTVVVTVSETVGFDGLTLDLPVALAILAESGQIPSDVLVRTAVAGCLHVDGQIRPVCGMLAIAEAAKLDGALRIICCDQNADEAAQSGLSVWSAGDLPTLIRQMTGKATWSGEPVAIQPRRIIQLDWSDVRGHEAAKRAMEVAAAGGHHVLLIGTPGTGKTMLARRMPTILPDPTDAEQLDVTRAASAAGLLPHGSGRMNARPFRAPHHTVSGVGLVGGGQFAKPGEVTLADRGVLFLDEIAEFPRHVLECLREPTEQHQITVMRGGRGVTMPSRFLLVGATTGCPCGQIGSDRMCRCSEVALERFRQRLSGPLFDLQVQLRTIPSEALRSSVTGDTSEQVRARVVAARDRQSARWGAGITNATVPMLIMQDKSPLPGPVHDLLRVLSRLGLQPRAHDRIWRLARTVADLAGRDQIEATDVAEALQWRRLDEPLAAGQGT